MGNNKAILVPITEQIPKHLELNIFPIDPLEITSRNIKAIHNYRPAVYIYGDSKSLYIGESRAPITRLISHRSGRLNVNQDFIYLITSDHMNASAIYNLETSLIDLFFASGDRELRNNSLDQKLHSYFMSETYSKFIEPLWDRLTDLDLNKNKYKDLIDSVEFKYSPYKSLNDEQLISARKIVNNLEDGITMVKGLPGTGKSVLATSLFRQLSSKYNVALTSTRPNSFRNFEKVYKLLKSSIKTDSIAAEIKKLKKEAGRFDVIIIDESHRLRRNDYTRGVPTIKVQLKNEGMDDELHSLMSKFKKVIIMYDENQTAHDCDIIDLEKKYNSKIVAKYMLTEQMRSKEGQEYNSWVNGALKGHSNHYKTNDKFEVKIFDNFKEMYNSLKEKSIDYPLNRLVAGYTYNWDSKFDDTKYDISIEGINLKWNNKDEKDWLFSKPAKDLTEVAYFDTIAGLDLHFSGVIIGKDIKFRNGKIITDISEVPPTARNQKPSKGIDNFEQEFHDKVINKYYILMTRSTKGVYLYIEDVPLREYLKSLIN